MNAVLFAAASLALLVMVELASATPTPLHQQWDQYKRQHGKTYATLQEEAQRFARFIDVKKAILEHNAKAATVGYKLGLNHLSDLSEEEFGRMNGLRYNATEHAQRLELSKVDPFLQAILDDPTPVPESVDWRRVHTRVSRVKNQGQCGSCWAFASTGALEGQQVSRKLLPQLTQLSEQDLVDCSEQNYGCDGGIMSKAFEDVATLGGIEREQDYPYVAPKEEKCAFQKAKVVMTDKGSVDLPKNDEEALKRVVAKYGPVATAIDANFQLQNYRSGIYDSQFCGDDINHAVLVVGYGTDAKQGDYWIVKNSWGESWGESGFFRMKRGKGVCAIGVLSTIPKF